jgi:hypothetical protein
MMSRAQTRMHKHQARHRSQATDLATHVDDRHFESAGPDIVGAVQAATHDPEATKLLAEVIHKASAGPMAWLTIMDVS